MEVIKMYTKQMKLIEIITVNPCAINSSGTNSGRNTAGVIHGQLTFTGSNVTIMSPLATNDWTKKVTEPVC